MTSGGVLDAFKPIRNSERAPCEMQKDVAEHNSRYDTLKHGKDVTYKAPCDLPGKQPASPRPPPKVS